MAWDNKVSLKTSVKAFMVNDANDANGRVDMKASELKFRQSALAYLADQEADQDMVGACLTVLYNTHKGVSLNTDFIVSEVRRMMVQQVPALNEPSTFARVKDRILSFLKENTGEGKVYAVKAGHGGGHYRSADRVVVVSATDAQKV